MPGRNVERPSAAGLHARRRRSRAVRPVVNGQWRPSRTAYSAHVKSSRVWIAYCTFSLCMVASVASYLWDSGFFWWPIVFSAIGVTVMLPVLLGPLIRATTSAFKE